MLSVIVINNLHHCVQWQGQIQFRRIYAKTNFSLNRNWSYSICYDVGKCNIAIHDTMCLETNTFRLITRVLICLKWILNIFGKCQINFFRRHWQREILMPIDITTIKQKLMAHLLSSHTIIQSKFHRRWMLFNIFLCHKIITLYYNLHPLGIVYFSFRAYILQYI